jgi:hypothetical protein
MKNLLIISFCFMSVTLQAQRLSRDVHTGLQVNQAGYLPHTAKTVVVKGLTDKAFQVVHTVSGQTVFEGTFRHAAGDFGEYSTGNFSELTKEGTYYVQSDTMRSMPFSISGDVYRAPVHLLLDYFAKQRCGASATGYLTPCHLDDGVRLDNGQHQDVAGGWHDASDLRKWVNCTIYGMTGLARAYELNGDQEVRNRIYAELVWGNDYFLKMQEADGFVMSFIGGEIQKHRDGNRWTDNKTGPRGGELHLKKPSAGESRENVLVFGDSDDRVIQTEPADLVAQYNFVAAEAIMARLSEDATYAAKCLQAAWKCFDWCRKNAKERDAGAIGASIIAAVEMYRTTGSETCCEYAVASANELKKLQINRNKDGASGFFRTSATSSEPYKTIWQGPLDFLSLCHLAQTFPTHKDAPQWKEMITAYSENYLRFFAERNGFGIVPYGLFLDEQGGNRRTGDYYYRYFMSPDLSWWVGINANLASAGVGLMKAASILDKPEWKAIAQRQLDWILGFNPFGCSTMTGVGYHHPRPFINHDQFRPYTPLLPGGVMNGLGGDRDDQPCLITENNYNQSEYWTPMVAYTLWLMSELDADEQTLLKQRFLTPPESMTTGVYWYWMSDNISKEGVVRDLQAMKRAGVNSAFIGNIGGQNVPSGQVKIFTDKWWEALHAAMKTAGELGIEIGMFNCPGWSQSGGPWIKPSQAMRYLTASETKVKGPDKVTVRLPVPHAVSRMAEWSGSSFVNNEDRPSEDFQDVCVLAFPLVKEYKLNLFDLPGASITVSDHLLRPDTGTYVRFQPQVSPTSPIAARYVIPGVSAGVPVESSITLRLPQPQTARSLTVYPAGLLTVDARLEAKVNGEYRNVASFRFDRSRPMLQVGHEPFAPSVISFEAVTSDEFRLVFSNGQTPNGLGQIILSPTPAVEKYPEKLLARLRQSSAPAWNAYLWDPVRASGDETGLAALPEQVVDISDKMNADGTLTWEAPEGEWLVLRMGMIPTYIMTAPATPEGTGLEMDKMSRAFVADHLDAFIGEVMRRIPANDRKTFRVIISDSWEKGGQNFTDHFIDSFKVHYGYDPTPFLPVMTGHVVGNTEISDRFLWDVRRLTADMGATNNVLGLSEEAHRRGLVTWLENYGDWGFPGEFLLFGKYADHVGGEFWEDRYKPYIPVAASCAHIYNKDRVYAEAFTNGAGAYHHHPGSLKSFGDAAFTEGMTRTVLHVYIHQPDEDLQPGINTWFGIEFNRKNTWFSQADLFTTYLKRCGLMLEQGRNIADVAYFIGENVPVNSGPFEMKESHSRPANIVSGMPAGYHADYVNYDVIVNDMKVVNGLLTLPHGISYRLLVLPDLPTMRPELLQKIEQLVADGAVLLGAPPAHSPSLADYPAADTRVRQLSEALWGMTAESYAASDKTPKQRWYGKGLVLSNMSLHEALEYLHVAPDFHSEAAGILYAHRSTPDREIYFVSNQNAARADFAPVFRVSKGTPELWQPVTGEISPAPEFYRSGASTRVSLQLEPHESVFVVFHNRPAESLNARTVEQANDRIMLTLSSPWTVVFESDSVKRGPVKPVIFKHLTDWSQNADERIRFFSGIATYKTVFHCPSSLLQTSQTSKLYLDLGKVGVMAKVTINGQYAGGVWTSPYRVRMDGLLREGRNTLEIEVVNTWVNRMIGDRFLPEEKRKINSPFNPWKTTSPLQESGLLGPVSIVNSERCQ